MIISNCIPLDTFHPRHKGNIVSEDRRKENNEQSNSKISAQIYLWGI